MQQARAPRRQTAPAGAIGRMSPCTRATVAAGRRTDAKVRGVLAAGKGEEDRGFPFILHLSSMACQSFPTRNMIERAHQACAPVEGLYHDNRDRAARHARAAGAGKPPPAEAGSVAPAGGEQDFSGRGGARSSPPLASSAFGENYVQELAAKAVELAELGLEWHFIGPLQSNKTGL